MLFPLNAQQHLVRRAPKLLFPQESVKNQKRQANRLPFLVPFVFSAFSGMFSRISSR